MKVFLKSKISPARALVSIVEYLLAVLIVLECNSVYSELTGTDLCFSELIVVCTAVLFIATFRFTKNDLRNICVFFFLFALYVLGLLAANLGNSQNYVLISRFLLFLPVMSIYLYRRRRMGSPYKIFEKIANVITVMAVISLFFWFAGSILGTVKPTGSAVYSWLIERWAPGYFGVYFETQDISIFGFRVIRNSGIFTEAPMHNLVLSLAIMVELFLREERSKGRMAILLATLMSTISVTGLIFVIIIFTMEFVVGSCQKRGRNKISVQKLLLPVLLIVCGYAVYHIMSIKSTSASYSIRMDDYVAGFKSWLDAPVLGNGFGTYTAVDYMSFFRSDNMGYSNSLMSILAQGGIYLLLVYLVPLFVLALRGRGRMVIIADGMVYLLATTLFTYSYAALIFISLGYSLVIKQTEVRPRATETDITWRFKENTDTYA